MKNEINDLLAYFAYDHLPAHLRETAKPLAILAKKYAADLPSNAETLAGLRKLLEAKDCLVRSALTTLPPSQQVLQQRPGWSGLQ